MEIIEIFRRFRTKVFLCIKREVRKFFLLTHVGGRKEFALPILVVYRISDAGYSKVKPNYINNENCLRNAITHFPLNNHKWIVIADNVCNQTYQMIIKYIPPSLIRRVSIGHGAGTFRLGLRFALEHEDERIVYFLENDYLHRRDSSKVLKEGFSLDLAAYVTLYDHSDKYGYDNPFVKGGEKTRVFLTENTHWKITSSTTMTFAAQVKTLKKDRIIFDRWTTTQHPFDFFIFADLSRRKKHVISPIPSYSTHGETSFLAPLIEWDKELITGG